MKMLITGASGFIGQKLIECLCADKSMEIFALSRNPVDMDITSHVKCIKGDVMDRACLDNIFKSTPFDAVIHLAAITEHHAIVENKTETFNTNLYGTINLLSYFNRHCKNALFLYSSTGKVYGQTNEMPITENALTAPTNILGKSKRITEEVIEFSAIPENKYLICRIFNIYGEDQKRSFLVPTIIDQLAKPSVHLGNLSDLRDYLYIDDLLSALCACIKSAEHFKNVDYVNIGSGQPTDVASILREMESIIGRSLSVTVETLRKRADEMPVEFCSNKKLHDLTGWAPQYSLRDGLYKTLKSEGVN